MRRVTPALFVASAAALWGAWSLCFRNAERASTSPPSGALETFVVFAVMLVVFVPLALRQRETWTRHTVGLVVALGVCDGINALCFFTALQRTTVAVAVLTHYLQPLVTAVAAPLFLGERWRARTFACLAVALLGLALLLRPWAAPAGDLAGAALGVTSAFFFSATVLIGKKLTTRLSTAALSAYPKPVSLVILAVVVPGAGWHLEAAPFAILVAGGLVFGALPMLLFYRGLPKVSASQAGVLTLCEPLVAVVVGVVAWHEALSPLGLVGATLVLAGAAAIALAPRSATADEKNEN